MSIWEWKKSYVDLWSTVHLLSGILLAFILIYLKIDVLDSLIIVITVAVGWEFFELIFGIAENLVNQSIDVLAVVLGYLSMLWVLPAITASPLYWYLFGILALLVVIMNFLGWRDYRRRGGEKLTERVKQIKKDL